MADAHFPQAVQLLVGTVMGVEMMNQIHHLHIQFLFPGIQGQNSGEEQLLIVGVGGEEKDVCRLAGGLPYLYPIGDVIGGKGVDFVDRCTGGEIQRQRCRSAAKQSFHIHKFVQKSVLPARNRIRAVGHCPFRRDAIKYDVQRITARVRGNGHRATAAGLGVGETVAVRQRGGIGKSGAGDGDRGWCFLRRGNGQKQPYKQNNTEKEKTPFSCVHDGRSFQKYRNRIK